MPDDLTPYEAMMLCREKAGTDCQMARDLGTSQPRIWRMLNSARRMHEEFVLTASEVYEVPPWKLRPDMYPRDLAKRFYGVDRRAGARV